DIAIRRKLLSRRDRKRAGGRSVRGRGAAEGEDGGPRRQGEEPAPGDHGGCGGGGCGRGAAQGGPGRGRWTRQTAKLAAPERGAQILRRQSTRAFDTNRMARRAGKTRPTFFDLREGARARLARGGRWASHGCKFNFSVSSLSKGKFTPQVVQNARESGATGR